MVEVLKDCQRRPCEKPEVFYLFDGLFSGLIFRQIRYLKHAL